MPGIEDLIHRSGPAEERLTAELERFSFGAAVSSIAEVTPNEGPDEFVKTVVRLGGICLEHAQHPETRRQDITLTGPNVPEGIADILFVFDTAGQVLLPGFGPPAPEEITTEVANTVERLNDEFQATQNPPDTN